MLNAECQKDRNEKSHLIRWLRSDFSVIRLGFEPKTHSLEGCCSIQLSYRTIIFNLKLSMSLKTECKINAFY